MSRPRSAKLRKLAPQAALATAILVGVALFAVATTARGASHRAQVASFDLTQTCEMRVQPNSSVDIGATLHNTGNEILENVLVDADAGTSDNSADDFNLTFQSGDTNNNQLLDPNETWTFTGSYTAPTEDVTNIVGADADSLGGTAVTDIAACETDVIQAPVPGVIVGAQAVQGKVLVKEPGTNKFVPLTGKTEIPVGSQVNTLGGMIRLTASLGGGQTNAADFYQGVFTIFQKKAKNAVTTLRLDGGNFRNCGRSAGRSLSSEVATKKPVRRLWGSGKGSFTTKGRYSSATVRGTKWLTQDQCNGTLTRVLSGVVRVRDFRLRKNIDVRAGHTYLARAPGA